MKTLFRRTNTLMLLLLATPLVIIIRILRPFILIRFGPLLDTRIGAFAHQTEVYLCKRDAGVYGKTFDFLYHLSPVCNEQLKKMWDRTLNICIFAKYIDRVNKLLPGSKKHSIILDRQCDDEDRNGLLLRIPPHISFTSQEEELGKSALQKLGIPNKTSFICFHARDAAYLNDYLPDTNWNYHNYRDSNIHNYIPAVKALTHKGYFAIRMGHTVKEALNTDNPKIIDYATNGHRSDFLDLYLIAKCRFLITSGTGICAIPVLFRQPIVFVNFIPIKFAYTVWNRNYVMIPKKLRLKKEDRFLSFSEIFNLNIESFLYTHQYEKMGIEAIENTPEEIMALAMEMEQRLEGTWQSSNNDEELQQRFLSLIPQNYLPNNKVILRIGTEFLRQNQELLI